MKSTISSIVTLALLITLLFPATTYAHSGRTDANGGHNCSAKSIRKGLCTGYHYHNGGSSGSTSSSKTSSSSSSSKSKTSSSGSSSSAKSTKEKTSSNKPAPQPQYTVLDKKLTVNDKNQTLQKSLILYDQNTYIYVRDFAAAFGYSVEVDQSKDVILSRKSNSIKIANDSGKIYLDGKYTGFNAKKINDSFYINLRAGVQWAKGKITSVDDNSVAVESK
ncbi:YHYH domain-containing protein [Paenibacillus sp. NPDC058071]|uniref:YHYH domain-containing protein n=1 Tax=Paenibacillus sp. NPDC058071 TaxID=3346326 RepID=UPI0036DCBF29